MRTQSKEAFNVSFMCRVAAHSLDRSFLLIWTDRHLHACCTAGMFSLSATTVIAMLEMDILAFCLAFCTVIYCYLSDDRVYYPLQRMFVKMLAENIGHDEDFVINEPSLNCSLKGENTFLFKMSL